MTLIKRNLHCWLLMRNALLSKKLVSIQSVAPGGEISTYDDVSKSYLLNNSNTNKLMLSIYQSPSSQYCVTVSFAPFKELQMVWRLIMAVSEWH
jgi:hypothetical protein